MKTNKTKKIKKVVTKEDMKIIAQQVKKGIVKPIAKGKAGAVKYDEKEVQQIVDQKKQEGINRQKDYRETVLARILKQEEILEMQKQISGDVSMQWSGMICPKPILKAQYNLDIHRYKNFISREKYLEQALINDGLTKDQVSEVLNGKYVKNWMKK